jgi:hypothetical protein
MTRADDVAEMIADIGENIRFRNNVISALVGSVTVRREYGEDGNYTRARVMRVMFETARITGGPVVEGETLEYEGQRYRVREAATAEGCIRIECSEELKA